MRINRLLFFAFILFFLGFVKSSFAGQIPAGERIVHKYGCIRCHSFIKGARIDGIISLADYGDKHQTLRQTEEAIRSCKADIFCSQILTNKQVKYVAYYLNSLKEKK